MKGSWRITKDEMDGTLPANGIACHDPDIDEAALVHEFRLYDDDGLIYYYSGVCDNCDEQSAFRPLDEWGQAFGCTRIDYKNKETGAWETL